MSLTTPTTIEICHFDQSNYKQRSHLPPDIPDIPKILRIIDETLNAQKPKPKPKIILFTKSELYESPPRGAKRKERSNDNGEPDVRTPNGLKDHPDSIEGGELDEDEKEDNDTGRTRSKQPKLFILKTPSHSRRPKLYPQLTPWGGDGMFRDLNDLYPEHGLDWDNNDIPDFDLGEPLDETNFWEGPWITANEGKTKARNERERKRKRQQRYGGLKAAGRKRAYKKRAGSLPKRGNGRFVKLEED